MLADSQRVFGFMFTTNAKAISHASVGELSEIILNERVVLRRCICVQRIKESVLVMSH